MNKNNFNEDTQDNSTMEERQLEIEKMILGIFDSTAQKTIKHIIPFNEYNILKLLEKIAADSSCQKEINPLIKTGSIRHISEEAKIESDVLDKSKIMSNYNEDDVPSDRCINNLDNKSKQSVSDQQLSDNIMDNLYLLINNYIENNKKDINSYDPQALSLLYIQVHEQILSIIKNMTESFIMTVPEKKEEPIKYELTKKYSLDHYICAKEMVLFILAENFLGKFILRTHQLPIDTFYIRNYTNLLFSKTDIENYIKNGYITIDQYLKILNCMIKYANNNRIFNLYIMKILFPSIEL